MQGREDVVALARAIAERLPVDWEFVQTSGDAAVHDTVRELKVIADIAALHGDRAHGDRAVGLATSRPWGPFRIVEHAGHGTYGDVYRAVDTRLDREVALKLLRQDDATTDSVGAAMLQEARLLARVRHPNVVTIHGADRIDGCVGLWMEFIEGRTLEHILQQDGPLSPPALAGVGLDVCRALHAVHDAGLLHRDVKAQNVMRDAHGRHVLMDFGAGRHAAHVGAADVAGTPLYLAPEVLDGAPASRRSDIYSVGVLLFHLATGRYPVEGRTLDELRARHGAGERVALRSLRPELPGTLVELIERALKQDASERFGSAREMADAAARLVGPKPTGNRRRAPTVVVTALLVLAAGTAASWLVRDRAAKASAAVSTRLLWDDAVFPAGTTSADGRLLSFIDWSTLELGVRDLVTGHSRVLRLAANVLSGLEPFTCLSPDGNWVAYIWWNPSLTGGGRGGAFELGVVSVRDETTLAPAMAPADAAQVLSWSPDGRSIAVMAVRSGSYAIEVVPADGGAPRTVAALQDEWSDAATFSPDGEWVAFHIGPAVFTARSDGSSAGPARITDATTLLGWTHDGRLLFTRDREGVADVFTVAMADGHAAGEPAKLETVGDMGRVVPFTLAPGRGAPALGLTSSGTLIHGRVRLATDAVIVAIDPTTGEVGPERVQREVAAFGFAGLAGGTRYSSDGTRVLYTPTADSVLIQEPDGRTRSLMPQLDNLGRLEWAPDGEALIIAGRRNADERGIYRVDLQTGAASLLVADERPASYGILHDGETLFYSKTDAPSFTIVARNLQTGVEREVYTNDDQAGQLWGQLRVSRDGRRLALVTLQKLEVVDLATGRLLRRIDRAGGRGFGGGDWDPEGRHLFVTVNYQGAQPRSELWRIPIDGGEPERHRLTAPARGGWMRADGREFSMVRWDERWQVWSVEHFLP